MMSPSQAAKIYHWVDENGRSHYSENLPHNTEAKALSIKATGKGSAGSASTTHLLANMNGSTQRRFKQEDGSYRKLEQSEIADYQSQAQEGIKNYCK